MNSDDRERLRPDGDEAERYRGHLSLCEIDLAGQAAIRRARVLVVGCGGLGSPVALYLAAAGVGTIGLADADTVALSNLQRQIIHSTAALGRPKVDSAAEAIARLNPRVAVERHQLMLTPDNIGALAAGYDIIADCTDSLASRLTVNDACVALGKPMSFGAVQRFSGMLFSYAPGHADYRAMFDTSAPDADSADTDCSCAATGVLNAAVGVVGSLQAAEVLKMIVATGDPLYDRLLTLDLLTMTFQTLRLQ